LADPARERGYQYTVALVNAIEDVVDAIPRRGFAYRGADLSRAIQCALFIGLVNDEALYEAFRSGDRGVERPPFELGALVARRLLDGRPSPPRAIAERIRWQLRDRRSGAGRGEPSRGQGSSTCFLLDHSKFLRFIAPVADRLGADAVTVVPLTADAHQPLADSKYAFAPLPEREETAASAIGAAVREWPASLLTLYDAVFELLGELRPGCTVVVEGNSPFDEVVNEASRSLGIPCVCLQQGWSPILHTGFRRMSFTRMAVWGRGFEELLAPYNPDQRFDALGNPALVAADQPGARSGDAAVAFFLQSTSPVIGERHLLELQELLRSAAERHPDATILVREHPGAPLTVGEKQRLEGIPNVRLVPASSHTLQEVILGARAAVSIYSTSLLEAAALGTPAIAYNPTSLPRYSPDLEELGIGVEVEGIEVALAALDRVLDESYRQSLEPAMKSFRKHYFHDADGRAPERIAELIAGLSLDES
jgi:hypothetical protein